MRLILIGCYKLQGINHLFRVSGEAGKSEYPVPIRFINGNMLVSKPIIKQELDKLLAFIVTRFWRSKPMRVSKCLAATLRTFQAKTACALIMNGERFLTFKTNLFTHRLSI